MWTREARGLRLAIVFAALAVSRWIEHQTGWRVRKLVRTARRSRSIEIQADPTPSPPPTRYRMTSNPGNRQAHPGP